MILHVWCAGDKQVCPKRSALEIETSSLCANRSGSDIFYSLGEEAKTLPLG